MAIPATSPSRAGGIGIDDDIDYKDVCYPDDPTGELALRWQLKSAFEWAGFRVTRVEKPSPYHPVWLIRLACQLERHFVSASAFHDQIRGTLGGAGIRLRKRGLTAQRRSNLTAAMKSALRRATVSARATRA